MELRHAVGNTFYIENDTNIGVFKTGRNTVAIIDTGSKGDGEKIDEIISNMGWSIDYIINTHTHIDHLGGNKYLMEKYGIKAYCSDIELGFAHYTDLESSYMCGGRPCRRLRKIFTHPGKIGFYPIEREALSGIEWVYLPGHSFGMIGIKTADGVWFTGDAYLSEKYLSGRSFGYLCDAGAYIDTLKMLKMQEGELYIPSHGIAENNIDNILEINIDNQKKMLQIIKEICRNYIGIDEILKRMYEITSMRNNVANHALLSSTMKSYLTYLQDEEELECVFIDNIMMWKTI